MQSIVDLKKLNFNLKIMAIDAPCFTGCPPFIKKIKLVNHPTRVYKFCKIYSPVTHLQLPKNRRYLALLDDFFIIMKLYSKTEKATLDRKKEIMT